LTERLESPAQQQSQEKYLVPRNCWLRISSVHVPPSPLEKNPRIRIRISVPNSARTVRTSYIVVDAPLLSQLQSTPNSAGFIEIPVDITVLCEYRHDVRFGHPSQMDFEIELFRTKALGSAAVDLASVLQNPIQTLLILRKDNATCAGLKIEVQSLCISKQSPSLVSSEPSASIAISESDSDLTLPIAQQTEQKIAEALSTNHLLLFNANSPSGEVFRNATLAQDYVVPISSPAMLQSVFDVSAQQIPADLPGSLRFVVAGDVYFLTSVLKDFLNKRDRGAFATDTFASLPPVGQDLIEIQTRAPGQFPAHSRAAPCGHRLTPNPPGKLSRAEGHGRCWGETRSGYAAPYSFLDLVVGDVLVLNASSQFVVPMFFELTIGDYSRSVGQKAMKQTFFEGSKDGTETVTMKFRHLAVAVVSSQISLIWRVMNNVNPLGQLALEFNRVRVSIHMTSKFLLNRSHFESAVLPVGVWQDSSQLSLRQ
jgi:hypothetical protein